MTTLRCIKKKKQQQKTNKQTKNSIISIVLRNYTVHVPVFITLILLYQSNMHALTVLPIQECVSYDSNHSECTCIHFISILHETLFSLYLAVSLDLDF